MQNARTIAVLWDSSHVWGLMALRAVRGLGLPCRLLRGETIAKGGPFGKSGPGGPDGPNGGILLVPGGSARGKAAALGPDGMEAIRQHVAAGGAYIGFCGGAGLALSHADGLGICPWTRARHPDRFQHLISGHLLARVSAPSDEAAALLPPAWRGRTASPSLPVWWPGRFAPKHGDGVEVLATCGAPDEDFWLADLPLRRISGRVRDAWRHVYGVDVSADFVRGRPLVVAGRRGAGRYVLSYSHLETPHSPDANAWLAHLLRELGGLEPNRDLAPAWILTDSDPDAAAWPPEIRRPLLRALHGLRDLLRLAEEHHLLFERAPWLWGWKAGLPGAVCNSWHAALCEAAACEPTPAALDFWRNHGERFRSLLPLFLESAEEHLLARRLAETLAPTLPDVVDPRALAQQHEAVFGHPMHDGGLLGQLLEITEELFFLCQADARP